MTVDDAVAAMAAEQHGTFARWQLLERGIDPGYVDRRLRTRRWQRAAPGVYQLPGVPASPEQRLWIAWLAVGPRSVVSHETAAERRRLGPVPAGRIVLTDRHGRHHRIAGAFVHQLDDVLDHHVDELDGLPTTTAPRTIVDLAAVSSPSRLARIVEDAVNHGRVTELAVGSVLAEVARPGKRGVRRLGQLLDARAPGDPVPESVLERLLLEAVVGAGNPRPVAQFPHPGRTSRRGWVDFAYPDVKVILEADGRRWHQRIADIKRDRARDNEAARAGWLTLRFMHEELRHDPVEVGRTVADVRLSRQ